MYVSYSLLRQNNCELQLNEPGLRLTWLLLLILLSYIVELGISR